MLRVENAGSKGRVRWVVVALAISVGVALMALAIPLTADAAQFDDGAARIAAATTVAPEPTAPAEPDDGTEDETGFGTSAVVLIVVVLVAVLLIFLAGRGSARSSSVTVTSVPSAPPPPPPSSRLPALRRVYSNGRMLLDQLDDREVARRRQPGHTTDSTKGTIESTLSELYGLEADAPTTAERSVLRETAESINALDRVVESGAASGVTTELDPARTRLARVLDRLADLISASS